MDTEWCERSPDALQSLFVNYIVLLVAFAMVCIAFYVHTTTS